MTQLAQIYERNDDWYFQASSRATTGLWIATPPLVVLNRHAPHLKKGLAALEVLNSSREDVSLPEDTSAVIAPLLSKAGVDLWPTFMKKARYVELERENNQLILIPNREIPRSKGSLEGIPKRSIVMSADTAPEAIGLALEDAFARCE